MGDKITFQPITDTTIAALRFCDSLLIRFGEGVDEASTGPQVQIEEQMVILFDRCLPEMKEKWDRLYESVFCFTASPQRLEALMRGSREEFRAAAQREVRDKIPAEVFPIVVDAMFSWFGRYLGRRKKS